MTTPLNIVWSRPLPRDSAPSIVTVSLDPAGRWFVSILVEAVVAQYPATTATVGVDAGITALLALSTGEKITNPKHEKRERTKLASAHRDMSRKITGSANHGKARRKLARVHARIADRRRDFLHKVTTRLVRENQTIVIEDLNVAGMLRNHNLARAISDAAWSQFRSMLEYEAAWYGRDLITVDRWFPSSKTCSKCRLRTESLPLHVREWACAGCVETHDRDVNAARNILTAGLAVTACGDGVRPTRQQSAKHLSQPPIAETEPGTIGREADGQVKIRLSLEGW
ncbi:RNA-guided endonuclease InsQ/TnpB family protein [Lentzea miocenica]|uniref:RNA-guided endonuclease InsQ/TnpB family protein n=1 Tax=Lentzea miocenica TaxID=3095431 RepID=UPI0038734641